MKCIVCNADLTDSETTIRHAVTKKFLDTCMVCIKDIGNIPIQVRPDLMSEVDLDMVEDLLDGDDAEFYDDMPDDDYYKDIWDERQALYRPILTYDDTLQNTIINNHPYREPFSKEPYREHYNEL